MNRESKSIGLYQVELTNFCNMCCTYCPHPQMKREKGHMSPQTLEKCIVHAKRKGLETLVVHHFGDPFMHPELEARLTQIAESGLKVQFSTNGLLLEKKLPILLSIPTKFSITLSAHQWSNHHPNVYFKELRQWQAKVADTNVSITKAFNATEAKLHLHNWAAGDKSQNRPDCFFLSGNWGVVLWNGDIVSCCVDCHGESVIGNIHDEDACSAQTVIWSGCRTCDLFRPAEGKAV